MVKNPILVPLIGFTLALAVNVFYYVTGNDLNIVVSRTLFADLMLVLTIVPVYEAIKVKGSSSDFPLGERIQSAMKPVAAYTLGIAAVTYVLFKIFGDPLVGQRMVEMKELFRAAVAEGTITAADAEKRMEAAKQIFSGSTLVLIVLMGNLLVGFISSILAAFLIRK